MAVRKEWPLMDNEIQLLLEFCRIPSPSGHEGKVARFLLKELTERGWNARIDGAGNVVGEIGQGERTLLFLGHIDTARGYFPVGIRSGRLFGRGSVDAKGAIAAFISAVDRVSRSLPLRIILIGAVGEETALSPGARYIVDKYRPDYCIVGEPSGWDGVTIGYKGNLGFEVYLCQPAGHSAGPHPSAPESAVDFWNKVIQLCTELNAKTGTGFAAIEPALLAICSENDGIADTVKLTGSLRLPPGCNTDRLIEQIIGISPYSRITFSTALPGFKAEKNNALVRAFLSGIRNSGGKPSFKVKGGTADMNIVGPAWGCPIIAYGPGDSSLDHTPDESLHLYEYGLGVMVISEALLSL
jgi:LysW-gamma-L-lysine carboxypeptidase